MPYSTARSTTPSWDRHPVTTRWLAYGDDLATELDRSTAGLRRPGDTIGVSEKVAVLLTGRAIPSGRVVPGRMARFLARHVRTVGSSCGLSIPEKMQLVLERQGRVRVLAAAACCLALRPLGRHGSFYRVAGAFARDLDGMRPPYFDLLFPPLDPETARRLAQRLEDRLGVGVAIVDVNDRGGSVRAVSRSALGADELLAALRDNPMGQGDEGRPFVVVRRSPAADQPADGDPQLPQLAAAQRPQHQQVHRQAARRAGRRAAQAVPVPREERRRYRGARRRGGDLGAAAAQAGQ
jgi:F420-0:gamma-glutamyl ligase